MDFIYIMFKNNWDDTVVYLSKNEAVKASLEYPMFTVQMFTCLRNTSMEVNEITCLRNNEYVPTYNYFLNGVFY